jgi:exonuclease SbcC
MRPLRLEVKGFTAFRDRQEIDFTGLDVFAICGPIGAGKSSLLDAMTYALYGRVERLDQKHIKAMISQGQPRMAVTLDFEVGHDRYRVTRTTPAKGTTKILLQRHVDGEWRQAGEGSDRITPVDELIRGFLGQTYDGFTRSVLLPQGKFAEFMLGDAKKRRDLLTELLDLSLFRRMAERAGQIAREAALEAGTKRELLEAEYGGVSAEAAREARREAKAARTRSAALAKAGGRVDDIVERWEKAERSIEDLEAYAAEAQGLARSVGATAASLRERAEESVQAGLGLRAAAAAARRATREVEKAERARRSAEERWGGLPQLSGWLVRAEALGEARQAADAARVELDRAGELDRALAAALSLRQQEVAGAGESAERAREAERAAAESVEDARHADLVATVSAGLKPGDPCPVCGTELRRVARRPAAGALRRADAAKVKAEKAREGTERALRAAERALDAAETERRVNAERVARSRRDLADRERTVRSAEAALEKAIGGSLPLDPAAAIAERIERLEALVGSEEAVQESAKRTERALRAAERERDRAAAAAAEERARLSVDVSALLARAARAAGTDLEVPPAPARPSERAGAAQVVAHATLLAGMLEAVAGDVAALASRRAEAAPRLVAEAREAVSGLLDWDGSLAGLGAIVAEARQGAAASAATAEQRASDLAERLGRRGELEQDVRMLQSRAETFRALAAELRADRLIAFLQTEAMQVLAAAGSERLATLSDGRYRLGCREDEFFVVDTWNGDEERSVRTLSGGETFLASLALALALSEQVRSLSVTDRARLDSLFLDEGFGTLDPESLRIVVEAIEQLGGDGRLVGVITHVRELAEQFPRFEVEKSPRGSRVQLVA